MNSIITLTTDFGYRDHHVGSMKGKLLNESRDFTIVDISHDVDPFDVQGASYVINSAYKSFAKGTVHVIGVDCEYTAFNKHVVMFWQDQYFVAADNGILSFLTHRFMPEKIYEITIHALYPEATSTEILLIVAAHIAKGGSADVIGREIKELKAIKSIQPNISADSNSIFGSIIYIDHFGNCISNINQQLIKDVAKGRDFYVSFGTKKITRIHRSYSDFKVTEESRLRDYEGDVLALFNANQFLEIAIYKSNTKTIGGAKTLFGLQNGSTITVSFITPPKKEQLF